MSYGFLQSSIYYIGSQVLILIFGCIQSFCLPKFLEPTLFGAFSLIMLVISFSKISHLGILSYFDRIYPQQIAAGLKNEAVEVKDTCFSLMLLTSTLFTAGAASFLWFCGMQNHAHGALLIFLAFSLILDNVNEFTIVLCRARQDFRMLSFARLTAKAVLAPALIAAAWFGGFEGTLIVLILHHILTNILYLYHSDKARVRLNASRIPEILRQSLSLYITLLLWTLLLNLDRILVSSAYPLDAFGIYNFGLSLSGLGFFFTGSVSYVFFPFLMKRIGNGDAPQNLRIFTERVMLVLCWLLPLAVSLFYFFTDFLIRRYLEKYTASLDYLPFFLSSTFFYSISQIPNLIIVALNRQHIAIFNLLLIILLMLGAFLVIRHLDLGLSRLASIFTLGMFLLSVLSFLTGLTPLVHGFKERIAFLLKCLGPALCCALICLAALPRPSLNTGGIPATAYLPGVVAVLLFAIPMLFLTDRQVDLRALARQTTNRKTKQSLNGVRTP